MQHWIPDEAIEAAPPADAWTAWLNHMPSHAEAEKAPVRPGIGMVVGLGLSGFWLAAAALVWRMMGGA